MVYPVSVKTVEEAKHLNQVATKQDFNIYLSYGNVMIDLKSLLGIFTLLGKECNLVAPDHVKAEDFVKALKQMGVCGHTD